MSGQVKTLSVLEEVAAERARQEEKWGPQDWSAAHYFAILAEEFGEVAKEVVELSFSAAFGSLPGAVVDRKRKLRTELIQTAAVAVAFIEALDRRFEFAWRGLCPEHMKASGNDRP